MKTSQQYFPVFGNCYYALQGHSNLSNFWEHPRWSFIWSAPQVLSFDSVSLSRLQNIFFDAWFDWFSKWNKYRYKKHNHVDIMCFSIITESIRNFYFCRWLLLVRAIFNFRPPDFRESLPPLFNLFKKVSIPTAIKRKAYNKCRKLNLKHQS